METDALTITLHSHVTVELVDAAGEADRREFTIVPARQADFKSGLLDENTPLAQVLLGHAAGEVLAYAQGDLKEVRIIAVASVVADGSRGAADARRAAVRQASRQSEITNQMIFATASGSKWGDYDVDVEKLLKEDEQEDEPPAGQG